MSQQQHAHILKLLVIDYCSDFNLHMSAFVLVHQAVCLHAGCLPGKQECKRLQRKQARGGVQAHRAGFHYHTAHQYSSG